MALVALNPYEQQWRSSGGRRGLVPKRNNIRPETNKRTRQLHKLDSPRELADDGEAIFTFSGAIFAGSSEKSISHSVIFGHSGHRGG